MFNHKKHRKIRDLAMVNTFLGSVVTTGALLGGVFLLSALPAQAKEIYNGMVDGQTLDIHLNTTFQYSNMLRVGSPSNVILKNGASSPNVNDGDANFRHGLVDNTFELLPVFNASYGNYGLYVSGEAFIDTPYLGHNQNNQPATNNSWTTDSNRSFTRATRNDAGMNAQLLDANLRGTWYFGNDNDQSVTVKVGRQTLMWGQSIFFAGNGIAGGMSPVDIWKALSLPNAQTQQILLPVGQAVVTYQPNNTLTLQGYYQFEWRHDALPAAGTYFSYADFLDKGGERLYIGPDSWFYRSKDKTPGNNNGQFGLSATLTFARYSVGFYALRWDSKTPDVYTRYTGSVPGHADGYGYYWLFYPKDIQTYGTSLSTNIGPVNVGSELSMRRNMPLVSGGIPDGKDYPAGNILAGQVSGVYISPGLPLDPGGLTAMGEIAFNHVLSVTSGRQYISPERNRTAAAFEFTVAPTYDDVIPNLNIQIPVGLSYNFLGNSEMDPTMNHGYGSYNIGVSATYRQVWTGGITYVGYYGKANTTLQDIPSLVDRSYVSFNISRTF